MIVISFLAYDLGTRSLRPNELKLILDEWIQSPEHR